MVGRFPLRLIAASVLGALLLAACLFSTVAQAKEAPMAIGIANLPGNCAVLPPLHPVSAERLTLGYFEPLKTELPCATSIRLAGYHLLISVQYTNTWSLARDRRWFTEAMHLYSPLHPYAVSVGNEQSLSRGHPRSATARHYDQVWRAVEPIIRRHDRHALRVAGEITPWGLKWFRQVVKDGLPGAQVYAAHIYPVSAQSSPQSFVALAKAKHVRAWATEGMCGPGVWLRYGCRSRAAIRRYGFSLALEWYALPPPPKTVR